MAALVNPQSLLLLTAAGIAVAHTFAGPDHYFPFATLARAQNWSKAKAVRVTLYCGVGHVLSSVALGMIGVALGAGISHINGIEEKRGDIAAYALIAFGLVYAAWGFRQAYRKNAHVHVDAPDHHEHVHSHQHGANEHAHHQHGHSHGFLKFGELDLSKQSAVTPFMLFAIFLLGPCEPMIPLLMVPAAKGAWFELVLVTSVFSFMTLACMSVAVYLLMVGFDKLRFPRLERFTHAIAGCALVACGAAIQFLGL